VSDDGPRLDGSGGGAGAPASRRVAALFGGFVATALLLVVVLSLGSWGYKYRRWMFHQGRLERLLELRPSAEQVKAGLAGEGAVLLGETTTAPDLERSVARWTPSVREKVVAKGLVAAQANIFLVGEMVYFVFFDREGKMVDFLVVERAS